ncbi:capsular biosynthesis protein [Erythrobacter sp. EC-HK427]|uniref:capsular biosynthesis protein n=1 Tax=Erythrobacter sp. EC-HK427 TaxID=2038396 RepID=UPI00125243B6|nr:capsular biosynthesis protein [Erythrobacter sp. EC-HK427]VVT16123.1 Capsular biosynthesis protein [Erythrobacter sp. EC-HK427]
MTEHRKIPTPGKSLFERAENFFGLGGDFHPAPVPKTLANPVNRRKPKREPEAAREVSLGEALAGRMPPRVLAAAPVAAAVPVAAPAPPPEPEPVYEDVTFPAKVHQIDREALATYGLIQPDVQATMLLEEFRIVKRQVLQSVRKARESGSGQLAQRVLVCSPHPNEGKSYCAVNLALALAAEKDSEVLLVDADFAKPSVLSMLGLPRGPGFMDALARQDLKVEDCVMTTDVAGLFVLPAGNHTTSDSEYLASERTGEVLDRLTRAAPNRIVIFDSSPALAASPAAELANHVGQAIVVARADRTGQSALEDALTLLSACPDLKLLLNAAHFSPSGRRFGAYYGQEA